jgi:hypothetical protein
MNGFLQSTRGNNSSSRLIGLIVVVIALIFAQEVLIMGRNDIVQAAIAAGTLFITIAGPAMTFLFFQKKNELQNEKNNYDSINSPDSTGINT